MEENNAQECLYHVPALLNETVKLLITNPEGVYVDATFGGGGHSREILNALGSRGRLFSFDRDLDAYGNRLDDPRFTFVLGNFRHLENFLRFYGVEKVDGVLADLGVSFHHFDNGDRGFSFRSDAPLDMRMNRNAEMTAARIIAESDEDTLKDILAANADLKSPRNVARAIIKARDEGMATTTLELAQAVEKALDPRQVKKEMAQVFQALRIETNHEKEDLQKFLESTLRVIKPGGRLAVLTYHSMEDRMVKNFIKTGNTEGIEEKDFFGNKQSPWKPLTKKPVEPGEEEIERNPRCRSARLRVAELRKDGK